MTDGLPALVPTWGKCGRTGSRQMKAPSDCTRRELELAVTLLFTDWLMLQRPNVRARIDRTEEELLAEADGALGDARAIADYLGIELPRVAQADPA